MDPRFTLSQRFLRPPVNLGGSLAGGGALEGDLSVARAINLGGALAGTGALAGALSVSRSLAGALAGAGTIAGDLEVVSPVAPAITQQPVSKSTIEGDAVELTVVATGVPSPTYQWKKDNVNISGATSATLSFATPEIGDTGYYKCVVTNSQGSVTSNEVSLSVVPDSTEIETDDLVAEWKMTPGNASGRVIPNTQGSADANLIEAGFAPDMWGNYFSGGSVSTTFGYTDKDGGTDAIRVQNTGPFTYILRAFKFLNGQQYTLSVWAHTRTGTDKTFEINGTISSGPVTMPADGSWVRAVVTFTKSGGDGIVNMSIGTLESISDWVLDGFKVELGGSATPYVRAGSQMSLSPYAVVGSDGANIFDGTHEGRAVARIGALALSAFTAYAMVKWNSSYTPDWVYTALFGTEADGATSNRLSLSSAGGGGGQDDVASFVLDGHKLTAGLMVTRDGNWHLVAIVYDGTWMKIFIDGMFVAQTNAFTGVTITTSKHLYFGWMSSGPWKGKLGYLSLYDAAHSELVMRQQFGVYQAIALSRGVTVTPAETFVLAEGDSITYGVGTGLNAFPAVAASTRADIQGNNFAVAGNKITDIAGRAATADLLATSGRTNILSVMCGTNDYYVDAPTPAAFVASLKSYCQARRVAGWLVVVCTITPEKETSTAFLAWRDTVNGLLRGDPSFYDALCDWADDPVIDTPFAEADVSNYYDYVHPTQAGHNRLAAVWGPVIDSLIP